MGKNAAETQTDSDLSTLPRPLLGFVTSGVYGPSLGSFLGIARVQLPNNVNNVALGDLAKDLRRSGMDTAGGRMLVWCRTPTSENQYRPGWIQFLDEDIGEEWKPLLYKKAS